VERFDAIVVGLGVAGCAAALATGRAGKRTLLLGASGNGPEKEEDGSGFLFHAHQDGILSPEMLSTCGERHLSEIRWMALRPGGSTTVDFRDPGWERPFPSAYSLSRSRLQSWLVEAAEKAGVEVRRDHSVEKLAPRGTGGIEGVRSNGGTIEAPVTLLTRREEARWLQPSSDLGTEDRILEETFQLTPPQIESRFGLRPQQGIAWEILPEFKPPAPLARAFLATRRDQFSLGVIRHGPATAPPDAPLESVLSALRSHTSIAPLLREASSLGVRMYSLPNGVYGTRTPFGAGYLLTGGALGLPTFDGIRPLRLDIELRSGWVAGSAISQGPASANSSMALGRDYMARLRSAGLIEEATRMRSILRHVTWNADLWNRYPLLLERLLHEMMTETGAPKRSVRSTIREAQKATQVGWATLIRDALRMGGTL
jgi:electron transfer flavoprotein-quinone oxidoreductase